MGSFRGGGWRSILCVMGVIWTVMDMCEGRSDSDVGYEARSVNSVGFQILKGYRQKDPKGNVVFSPITISAAFAMAHSGAKGKTRQQLEKVFGYQEGNFVRYLREKADEGRGKTTTTSYAARVFVNTGLKIKRGYLDSVGRNRVSPCAFSSNPEAAKKVINDFVSEATHGLIPTIIADAGAIASASMALVSAIYFEGEWEKGFHKDYTHKSAFRSSDGKTRTVDFMATPAEIKLNHRNDYGLDSQILELPYKGGKFSMMIVLPNKPNGWHHVEQKLLDVGHTLFSRNEFTEEQVILRMPKFEMEFYFRGLKSIIQNLGVKDIFTPSADLSGITDAPLRLSDVVHKAKIKVNEKGTQAAAATGLFTTKSLGDSVDFIVNHPFLYFILDKRDGTILFQGTVTTLR